MSSKILECVPLCFDPKKETGKIAKIFADDMARILWLAIRPSHAACQYFNGNILACAKEIKKLKDKRKLSADILLKILSGRGKHPLAGIISEKNLAFAEELLPFVMGEKTITYRIGNAN